MRWQRYLNAILKALLIGLLFHAILNPDLAQYQNKGMRYRYLAYPLGAFAVAIFRGVARSKKKPYPYLQDILLTSIITFDMLGNTLAFYGNIKWWDGFTHFINSALLTWLVYSILKSRVKKTILVLIFSVAIVAWLQLAWEIAEYVTFITNNACEFGTAYQDTISDLALGQLGCLMASTVMYLLKKKKIKTNHLH